MKDPYLIKDQPCEVWNISIDNSTLRYFILYRRDGAEEPLFRITKSSGYRLYSFRNYYPIGTEWDRGRYPEWALCSVVGNSGTLEYWSTVPVMMGSIPEWGPPKKGGKYLNCGLCPDHTRWQDGAWKTSLRMKPAWAE